MYNYLLAFGYLGISFSAIIGAFRYRRADAAMRILIIQLLMTAVSESVNFLLLVKKNYTARYGLFHTSSILEMILVSAYFIRLLVPGKLFKKLLIVNIVIWISVGTLNIVFLQPIDTLNTNLLMLESLGINTMSLYTIYWMLKKDIWNIFAIPHFWVAILWLLLWSSTFFFWAFIKILYRGNWQYQNMVLNGQAIINIIVYTGIALILFFYPKMKKFENR